MSRINSIYRLAVLLLFACVQLAAATAYARPAIVMLADTVAQPPKALTRRMHLTPPDTLLRDSLQRVNEQNFRKLDAAVDTAGLSLKADSAQAAPPRKVWIPNSTKAVWLAAVFPGAGQIYNRKYWKLPIIYGGFVGCAYALSWNNQMYSDYSQAYLDIMDSNPNTNSFQDFLPIGVDVNGRLDFYKKAFKKKKDFYRRNRDLSIFCFIGVYLISIIDAYVDAELSDFDISKDLGLKIEPSVINDQKWGNSIGLQCSLKF